MKRVLLIILLILTGTILLSCEKEESSSKKKSSKEDEANVSSSYEEKTPAPKARYFGNFYTQYDQGNSQHLVFFGFSETEGGDNVRQNATINISISNDKGELVYQRSHKVTGADYSIWSSQVMGSKLLGCIYINDKAITPGASANGTLTISAELDSGEYWDEYTLMIMDLPLKPFQLTFPELPLTLENYSYSGALDKVFEVQDITYELSDWGSLTAKITVKLLQEGEGRYSSEYCYITYKVKNSQGIIVNSGTWMIGPIEVGDTILASEYIYADLDRNEAYTIEISGYAP